MNKKQSGIIVTLVVLLVFAGYLATKVNGPLYVNDSDFSTDKSAISLNKAKLLRPILQKENYQEPRRMLELFNQLNL